MTRRGSVLIIGATLALATRRCVVDPPASVNAPIPFAPGIALQRTGAAEAEAPAVRHFQATADDGSLMA